MSNREALSSALIRLAAEREADAEGARARLAAARAAVAAVVEPLWLASPAPEPPPPPPAPKPAKGERAKATRLDAAGEAVRALAALAPDEQALVRRVLAGECVETVRDVVPLAEALYVTGRETRTVATYTGHMRTDEVPVVTGRRWLRGASVVTSRVLDEAGAPAPSPHADLDARLARHLDKLERVAPRFVVVETERLDLDRVLSVLAPERRETVELALHACWYAREVEHERVQRARREQARAELEASLPRAWHEARERLEVESLPHKSVRAYLGACREACKRVQADSAQALVREVLEGIGPEARRALWLDGSPDFRRAIGLLRGQSAELARFIGRDPDANRDFARAQARAHTRRRIERLERTFSKQGLTLPGNGRVRDDSTGSGQKEMARLKAAIWDA